MPLSPAPLSPIPAGTQLRHYKGGRYTVVGSCLIEATLQPGVLYKPLQGDSQNVLWLRPLAEFHDQISTDAGVVPRFVKVADQPEKTNARTRERVTAVADKLTDELAHWSQACQRAEERLAKAESLVGQLRAENELLKRRPPA